MVEVSFTADCDKPSPVAMVGVEGGSKIMERLTGNATGVAEILAGELRPDWTAGWGCEPLTEADG